MTTKDIRCGDGCLPINEFQLKDMVENPSLVMVAKRGSGKSFVCRAILNHYKDIPVGLIIAPTDRMNCFYGNFFPDTYIHCRYESQIIEKLLRRQEEMIDKAARKKLKGKSVDPKAFIVMDDCLGDKKIWAQDPLISELLFNGRHFQLMYILTMQYPLGIKPELRSNFDYIFLLAEDFITNLKKLYDHYAGMFPDFNSFRQAFKQLTSDYGCMVIANRGARANFLEKIYWYRAPEPEEDGKPFGCKQFNDYHKNNYNHNWRKTTKPYDAIDEYLKQKKGKGTLKIEKRYTDPQTSPQNKKNIISSTPPFQNKNYRKRG